MRVSWAAPLLAIALGCGDHASMTPATADAASPPVLDALGSGAVIAPKTELEEARDELAIVDAALAIVEHAAADDKMLLVRLQRRRVELRLRIVRIEQAQEPPRPPPVRPPRSDRGRLIPLNCEKSPVACLKGGSKSLKGRM